MMLVAKAALGLGGALVLAGAYTFHEGVIRVDVDENTRNGSHVHVWAPAAMVPMAMRFVPKEQLHKAGDHAAEFMPLVHAVAKELQRYPEAEFVEVEQGAEHVVVRTHNGSLLVDVTGPDEEVHVKVPLVTIDDVAEQLAEMAPAS